MMNKKLAIRSVSCFAAGLALGAAFMFQIPNMLKAQRERFHHPDYLPGALVKTGRPYDMAINGRGYFQFTAPDGGIMYSRVSEFHLDETGTIVSRHGYMLEPSIQIPNDSIGAAISIGGYVTVFQPSGVENQVGKIQIAGFPNPDGLEPTPDGYFKPTSESGAPISSSPGQNGYGFLEQGYRLLRDVPIDTPSYLLVNGPYFNGMNDEQQEPLTETGRTWDFGIEGPGFLQVTLPEGMYGYTRYLNLDIDETGNVVKRYSRAQGIRTGINIEANVQKEEFRMENIRLYRFASPENLHYYTRGIYLQTEQSGPPMEVKQGENGAGILKRGFLNQVPRCEP